MKVLENVKMRYPYLYGIGIFVIGLIFSDNINFKLKKEIMENISPILKEFVFWLFVAYLVYFILNKVQKLQKQVDHQKKVTEAIKIRYGWRTQKIIDASGKLYEDTSKEDSLIKEKITKMLEGEIYNPNEIEQIIKESFYL